MGLFSLSRWGPHPWPLHPNRLPQPHAQPAAPRVTRKPRPQDSVHTLSAPLGHSDLPGIVTHSTSFLCLSPCHLHSVSPSAPPTAFCSLLTLSLNGLIPFRNHTEDANDPK